MRQVNKPSGNPALEFDSRAFRAAELRSENARVTSILTACASLLALILMRGLQSVASRTSWRGLALRRATGGHDGLRIVVADGC